MSAQFLIQQGAGAVGIAFVAAVGPSWGLAVPILVGCALSAAAWVGAFQQRKRIETTLAALQA
jgi:hypothetical protein